MIMAGRYIVGSIVGPMLGAAFHLLDMVPSR